ncbi:MAG TPA: hypothetical protein VEJ86_00280 [Candidatus Binataceae bacterium]|nr:hypothetical protein [Candidatus Binataceae bacterium]
MSHGALSRQLGWLLVAAGLALSGCGVASAPIKNTDQVVATPQPGQFTVSVAAHQTVGNVVPVQVSIANGTDDPRSVVPSQVFAINEAGERVAPLPPGEAARQSGNAGELKAALGSAAVSGALGGGVGAGLGAAAGSAFGAVGTGAILGGAIGGAEGIFRGAEKGQDRADREANQQISALALKPEEVAKNFTVTGYVFYPKGTYQRIDLLLVDRETGDTQTISEPWH